MDAFKAVVFKQLATVVAINNDSRKYCELNGHAELATQASYQTLGVKQAIEALGYNVEEFDAYYKENQHEMRAERESNIQ